MKHSLSFSAFERGIQKLQECFAPSKYTAARADIIRHFCRDLTDEEFSLVVDRFIASKRSLPVPDDYAEQVKFFISRRPKPPEEAQPHVIIHKICSDTGTLWVDVDGIAVLHACHCERGERHPELVKYDPKTMRLAPFPHDQFKPTKKTGSLSDRIADRVAWYTGERRLGESYARQVRGENEKRV